MSSMCALSYRIINYDKSQLFINQTMPLATTQPIIIKPNELKTISKLLTSSLYVGLISEIQNRPILIKFSFISH